VGSGLSRPGGAERASRLGEGSRRRLVRPRTRRGGQARHAGARPCERWSQPAGSAERASRPGEGSSSGLTRPGAREGSHIDLLVSRGLSRLRARRVPVGSTRVWAVFSAGRGRGEEAVGPSRRRGSSEVVPDSSGRAGSRTTPRGSWSCAGEGCVPLLVSRVMKGAREGWSRQAAGAGRAS